MLGPCRACNIIYDALIDEELSYGIIGRLKNFFAESCDLFPTPRHKDVFAEGQGQKAKKEDCFHLVFWGAASMCKHVWRLFFAMFLILNP
jgi:hypothetical protein